MTELRQIPVRPAAQACVGMLVMCEVQKLMHDVATSGHTLNVPDQRVSLQMAKLGFEYVCSNI